MKMLEYVGRETSSFFEYVGGAATLLGDSTGFILTLRIRIKETLDQAYRLGVESTAIVCLTSLFTGFVISLESATQAVQYGAENLIGGGVAFISVRELGPMLSAVVVAGRTGAAIAAEIGSMVVTEQVEALQALGLSPVRMLVVPRLVALMLMMPLLTVFADLVSFLGGMWIANSSAHVPTKDDDNLSGCDQGALQSAGLCGHHRGHRCVSGTRHARRSRRCRQVDDGGRRDCDHLDLHRELRDVVHFVSACRWLS
jgi:ABC transport permease subunit